MDEKQVRHPQPDFITYVKHLLGRFERARERPKVKVFPIRMSSDFLSATPCVLYGLARLLDLAGQFDTYNYSRTPEEADAKALYWDWRMVGHDLEAALTRFDEEYGTDVRRRGPQPVQMRLPLSRSRE